MTLKSFPGISDIDECAEGIDNCSKLKDRACKNINGSYECVCRAGYKGNEECLGKYSFCSTLSTRSAVFFVFFSVDINECSLGIHLCQQQCNNTLGSYTCGCNEGYYEDGYNCTGNIIITINSYVCVCLT